MTSKDGFVLFAGELNTERSTANNNMQIVFAGSRTGATWQNMLNHLQGIKYDTFGTSNSINTSLSTGSYVNASYQMKLYFLGSPVNAGFETAPLASGTQWESGTNNSMTMSVGAWVSGTGAQSLWMGGSKSGALGSAFVRQVVNLGSPTPFYSRLTCDEATYQGTSFQTILGGSVLNDVGVGYYHEFDISLYTGSRVLQFLFNADASPIGSFALDNIQLKMYGSGTTHSDDFISTITPGLGPQIVGGTLFVNGSFPTGTTGSYFLSANSGTNWEGVSLGSFLTSGTTAGFGNVGSQLAVKITLYGSGTNTTTSPQIYEYGVQWTEE